MNVLRVPSRENGIATARENATIIMSVIGTEINDTETVLVLEVVREIEVPAPRTTLSKEATGQGLIILEGHI